MDAFASPSIRAEGSTYSPARPWELLAVTIVVGLGIIAFPVAPNIQLDSSWQVMLIHAHAAGLQFGRDIIFTWGPWGFLCSRFELGSTAAGPLAAWTIGGPFLLAGVLAVLTRGEPLVRRLVVALTVIAVNWVFQDALYFAVIVLLGIKGLMNPRWPSWALGATVLFLGFLGQLKFTYLVLSGTTVLAAVGTAGARRAWVRGAALATGFGASVLLTWVAAGQNPDNLYPYLRRSVDIAGGYGEAMQYDESWLIFGAGVVAIIAALGFCWKWARWGRDRAVAPWGAAALAIALVVMWKESYTRADLVTSGGHVLGLFSFMLIVMPALGSMVGAPSLTLGGRGLYLLAWAGLALVDPGYFQIVPEMELERYYGAIQGLRRVGHLADDWEAEYRAAAAALARPAIKAAVGTGTADAYDFSTATLLLNGLALSTRPIFQSYSAYTPSLEGWNLRYYQSIRAPDFLLWNEDLVDHRYPGEDDAMLVGALPGHYVPVLAEGGSLLLRRTSPLGPSAPDRRLLFERSVGLDQEITLPALTGHPLWLEVDAVPNLLGRLRGLLYKPAILQIVTTDSLGRQGRWRIVPRVARTGFLLVPTLEHPPDVAAYLQGFTENPVRTFHFEAPDSQDEFWDHIDFRALEVSSQSLRYVPSQRPVDLAIFDRRAASIDSIEQLELISVAGEPALLLHAAGAVRFEVGVGIRRLIFSFGIRPGAYTGDGHTAGVEFSVERTTASGKTEVVWRRRLDPVAEVADRGTQSAAIDLPADEPASITIRTAPSPGPSNSWDWSYVAKVRFAGGATP